MWESLRRRGIEEGTIKIILVLYKNSTNKVRAHNYESTEFITKIGLKQGCVLSLLLFSIVLDDALRSCKGKCESMFLGFWRMKAIQLQDMLFADDLVIVVKTKEKLQNNVNKYQKELSAINMEININKSKTMIIANEIF